MCTLTSNSYKFHPFLFFFINYYLRVHFSTALSQAHLTFAAFEAFMVFTAPKGKGSKKGK